MSAPFGHALMGMAIARRLGVRSRSGLAASAMAANLPDVDIFLGMLLYRDPWRLHRKATHRLEFALAAGSIAGLAGVVSAGNIEGERDLIADTLTGVAIVGSHMLLDKIPYFPEIPFGPSIAGLRLPNWFIDAAQWGAVAWLIWPRERDGGASR